ncbi:MAG: nucleotidyltransferase domain-containing protein [Deltaproteobacteria bacterium]|nr:nucleotidyltransferase domain-containing protein [Deltaproteobacteria bacterium]
MDILDILKTYFKTNAEKYGIKLAFLYGSYAHHNQTEQSDIDVALVFEEDKAKDKKNLFEVITDISIATGKLTGKDVEIIFIDSDFSKPLLYYNAIVHGKPLFVGDANCYIDYFLRAIYEMEDFSSFGLKWQLDIANKRLEKIAS